LSRIFYMSFLGLLGAVIVHIALVLLLPSHIMRQSHLQRIAALMPAYQFAELEKNDPIITMLDPAFLLRICHFDLSLGTVSLTAQGHVPFWSLSLYMPDGSNIYSLNSTTSPTGGLDLVLGDTIGIMDYRQSLEDNASQVILSGHDIEKGFVILRVFSPSPDWALATDAFLQSASCRPIDRL